MRAIRANAMRRLKSFIQEMSECERRMTSSRKLASARFEIRAGRDDVRRRRGCSGVIDEKDIVVGHRF